MRRAKSLSDIIESEIDRILEQRPTMFPVLRWNKIVGSLSSNSIPGEIHEKELTVYADSPGVASLLSMKKIEIIKKIEKLTNIKLEKVNIRSDRKICG